MAESKPSYRSPCILVVDGKPVPSLFAANYDALIRSGVENNVNLGSSGAAVFISYNAASVNAGVGTLTADAYVIHGDPLQRQPIVHAAVEEQKIPIDAERVLAWITKQDRLDFVLDTFEVNFQKRVLRDGESTAKAWLWWQIARTMGESVLQLSPRIAGFVYLVRKIMAFFIGS